MMFYYVFLNFQSKRFIYDKIHDYTIDEENTEYNAEQTKEKYICYLKYMYLNAIDVLDAINITKAKIMNTEDMDDYFLVEIEISLFDLEKISSDDKSLFLSDPDDIGVFMESGRLYCRSYNDVKTHKDMLDGHIKYICKKDNISLVAKIINSINNILAKKPRCIVF